MHFSGDTRFLGMATGAALVALLAGCSALPAAGPMARDFVSQESQEGDLGGYVLIDLDEHIASICNAQPRNSLVRIFSDQRPAPDIRIGTGDTVSVTIWEAAAGGLFSAAPTQISAGSRSATLPEQVVARDGTIQVPYAGRIKVSGRRPDEVEQQIVDALKGKAIEPQALVTISRNYSNTATVTGEVTGGARVPLTVKGDRILSVIATAGGIKVPAFEAFVRLTRGKSTATIAFNTILTNPSENIYVRPDDVITVIRQPQTFTVFGGTGKNASMPFDAAGISLEEAIAKAGGLNDALADPAGIFLLRFEPTELVSALEPGRQLPSQGNLVPVIYRLNLRNANSFFLARAFQVKDKDMIYIADSPSTPVQKFLGLVGTITAPAISGVSVYGAAGGHL
jgi:polysaccharide export outer membrane protein